MQLFKYVIMYIILISAWSGLSIAYNIIIIIAETNNGIHLFYFSHDDSYTKYFLQNIHKKIFISSRHNSTYFSSHYKTYMT